MTRCINIFSPGWETQDSYGRIALEVSCGFEAHGYHVNRFGPGEGAPRSPIRPATGGIFLGYPTLIEKWHALFPLAASGTQLALTMFESSQLPDDWREPLNRSDAIVTPARFMVDVFASSGVTTTVHVEPLGVSEAFFVPRRRRRTAEHPLTFLAIADRGRRKGWHKALFAFLQAFGHDRQYQLILKTRNPNLDINNANVSIINADLSNAEMAQLYRQADVMIFPTAGEGFGLPPREFAATGGVALATNWGGTADDLPHWGIGLPYQMVDAWPDNPDWYGQLGQWADVDVNTLARILRCVAEDFAMFAEHGMRAAQYVQQRYQWDTFTASVMGLWETIAEVRDASAG